MTRWKGVASDERRAARRELLLDAAFELLGTEGWAGTSVRRVCSVARLNPRYFYESFDDLEALLLAVYDRIVVDGARVLLRAVVEAPADDERARVKAAVDACLRFVVDDPRRARVLFAEAHGSEALQRRRLDTMYAMAEFLDQTSHLTPLAAHLLVGGAFEVAVMWLDGKLDLSLDALVDETAELLMAFGAGVRRITEDRAARASRD